MSYEEIFVGSLSIVFSLVAIAIGLGPWQQPYMLPSVSSFQQKYGKPAARGLWVAVAIALLSAGIAIINGFRPKYAAPSQQSALER